MKFIVSANVLSYEIHLQYFAMLNWALLKIYLACYSEYDCVYKQFIFSELCIKKVLEMS